MNEIQLDINSLIVEYEKESKGPAKIQVLTKEIPKLIKKLMGSANRSNTDKIDKIDKDYKLKMQEMETKISLSKQELERLQDSEKNAKEKVFYYINLA